MMLMFSNFILLLYIVTVFSNSTTSHENEAKVVDVAVKAFTASSSNSPDVLTALNTLGPNTAVLFKSFLRIRPNVSQTLDLMLQRDEYKELINFNRPTDALWNNFADRFGVGIFRMLKDNSLKATLPMMALSELSSQYYNPKFHKHNGFIPAFEQVCLDYESGPRSITKYLVSRLVTECQTPLTPEDAKEIASHRVYFMQVLLRLQVLIDKTVPDLGLYLAEFILIRNQFKRDILSEQLCSFTQQYFYYKDAIKALFNELRTKASIENNQWEDNKPSMKYCLLKHLFLSFNFNHRAMVAFADKLRNELINLTQHAAICATIMYKKDEEAIEQYQNVIVNDITRIGTHVSQYFNNSLLSAWPSTHNGILKEQMLLNSPNSTNVDQNKLKMVTNLTRSLLANTGLPNYVYEILIVREANHKYESHFNGDDTRCSFYKHNSGFNTIIGRIPFNSADQYEKLRLGKVMEKQRAAVAEVNKTIQTEIYNLYADPTLPMIAESLKRKIGKDILLDYKFSCWAIIRKWRWMTCPVINYVSSSFGINDLESIAALSYKNKGSFTQDCEDFRFFFFV